MIVVSNTSLITNLAAVHQLPLLQQLYGIIVIAQAVYDELTGVGKSVAGSAEVQTFAWIQTQKVANEALVVDATVFVPDIVEYWGNFPSFIGLTGFFLKIRFAVDPVTDTFYFGTLP